MLSKYQCAILQTKFHIHLMNKYEISQNRRYRDKERSEPERTSALTTPRATTPSEKKPTINVTVNPKSLATTGSATVPPAKTLAKPTKKIDMGAATNFGRDEIGINSPTHRNTHAEEDLFGGADVSSVSNGNKTDLLEDILKTCNTTNEPTTNLKADEDFFNIRNDDAHEFGDFASAFGDSAQSTATEPKIIDNQHEEKRNEFADFTAAFDLTQSSSKTNNTDNLLFAINTTSTIAQVTASSSNQKVGDLLSDLDGLRLDVSLPTGKFLRKISIPLTHLLSFFLHFCIEFYTKYLSSEPSF